MPSFQADRGLNRTCLPSQAASKLAGFIRNVKVHYPTVLMVVNAVEYKFLAS